MENSEQNFCQSCGMPLSEEHFGKNSDGSINEEYCVYCFSDGHFTSDVTMDEMIDHCLQFIDEFNKDSEQKMTKEEAREQMLQLFPQLKRWKS